MSDSQNTQPVYPAVASVPPRAEDLSALMGEFRAFLDRAKAEPDATARPVYPAHTPPSVADIGAFISATGVPAERVGPLIARVQAEVVGSMVRVIEMITGEIMQAHRGQMAQFAAILQAAPTIGFGGHREALVRLLLSDPAAIQGTLLAAQYDGKTDWRDSLPANQR